MRNSEPPRLVNLLAAAATGVTDAVDQSMLAATGLDAAATEALVALLDFTPSGTVQRLSQAIGLTHSGTVRLVDRLATDGLVTRATGADARSRSIVLTAAGRRLARAARRARAHAVSRLLGDLGAGEREALEGLAARLVEAVTARRLAQRAAGAPPAAGALCRLCDFAACGRPTGRCPAASAASAPLTAAATSTPTPGSAT